MVGERLKDALDREPFWRKAEDRIRNPTNRLRNAPGKQLRRRVPRFQKRNFGAGIGAGTVASGVAVILEDTVGVPFGADSDVQDVTPAGDGSGNIYTVNVNAPTENMAKARAFIDAGTGFTSILTDALDVQDVEVLGTRMLRDTYQVKLKIKD